ncbi:hypothetical protein NSS79_20900 [Paenibacillus sp. FSL L8-0436]|uniref:hypothetical protein n=1 Tax=Paenibacillus sp. FSL L8-0436 TaxID=2954686 RepID=UPI003158D104
MSATRNSPASITAEVCNFIRPYTILPMVKAAFERDSQIFLSMHTLDPYVAWLTQARERLTQEELMIKAQARQSGISIIEKQHVDGTLRIRYQCQAGISDLAIPDAEVAEEAADLMRRLLTF